jgi:hypothetical protein
MRSTNMICEGYLCAKQPSSLRLGGFPVQNNRRVLSRFGTAADRGTGRDPLDVRSSEGGGIRRV